MTRRDVMRLVAGVVLVGVCLTACSSSKPTAYDQYRKEAKADGEAILSKAAATKRAAVDCFDVDGIDYTASDINTDQSLVSAFCDDEYGEFTQDRVKAAIS